MTDVDLAAVNRREDRLRRWVLVLAVAVALLVPTVAVLAARIGTGVELLEERTPVIARIDEAERQHGCLGRVGFLFDLAVLGVLAVDPDDRDPVVLALQQVALDIEAALARGDDPCTLDLPPLPDLDLEG